MSLPPDIDAEDRVALSVVIPAFNEERRLPQTLLSVVEYLDARAETYEVIVVDDGSRDTTAKLVRQFSRLSPRVRLLACPQNHGKGFAVRLGIMNAVGERILYEDADGASPIEELVRLEAELQKGADIAIGSRAMVSAETAVRTIWLRKFMGRVFNFLVNVIVVPGIEDTQCGFKLFTRDAARFLFSRQQAEGFSFDVEIIFLAQRAKLQIAEVPVNWTNIPGSKVNLVKDSILMLADVVRFRVRDLMGSYGVLTFPDELRSNCNK